MLLFFVFFALFGSFWFFYAVFLQIRFVEIYAPFRIKSFWLACVKSCIFASLLIVCYIVYNFLNLHDKKYLNCYPWHSDCCPDIGNFMLASIQVCCACWLQTLPDATPLIGKINLFHNISVTFEQTKRFFLPFVILNVLNMCNIVYFIIGSPIFNQLDLAAS